jgi:hypothetical protein
MFAAPSTSDVEAQRAAAAQQNAAPYTTTQTTVMYPQQGTDPNMMKGATMGQPQQGADAAGATAKRSTISRVAASAHWGTFILLIAFFSLIVMIASAQVCDNDMPNGSCHSTRGYQVAAGLISLFIAFIFGILEFGGCLTHIPTQVGVSAFLFLWWVAAVIVLTFFGDFTTTDLAAGYFATWGAFIVAILSLVHVSSSFETGLDKTLESVRKPLFFLIIASLVVMGASIGPCSPRSACSGYSAYAVVASVISLVIAIVLFFIPSRVERRAMRWVAYFLVIWWIFAAACLTLGAPFKQAGNGFFGCYGALLSSAWLASMINKQTQGQA